MSVAVDRDAGASSPASAGSPTRSPPPTPTTSTATPASPPRRSTRCARERALSALVPERAGRRRRLASSAIAAGLLRARAAAAARARWSSRCTRSRSLTIVRHLRRRARGSRTTCATLVAEQRLIASVTSEVGTGGDMGRSVAAVTPADDGPLHASRSRRRRSATAPTPTTCSRRCAAHPTPSPATRSPCCTRADQTTLEPHGHLGPAGDARHVLARLRRRAPSSPPEQVLPTPFSTVAAESMVPVSHILWSHLWLGIATDAFDRARAFVRAAASRTPGEPPPPRPAPVAR